VADGQAKLVDGVDYYMEDGKMVLKPYFLLKRGYCCNSGCRHCPYGDTVRDAPIHLLGLDDSTKK
jgi:hypothetical protein